MVRKNLMMLTVAVAILCIYCVLNYPILTIKVISFASVTVILSYIAFAGFRLITSKPLKDLSIEELKKSVCRKAGLRQFSICLSGIDGSGKSSQALALAQFLRNLGFSVKVVWGRWPAFSSYLVLGVGKILGFHMKTTEPSGYKRIIPHYHNQRLLGKLYIFSMLIDIQLFYIRLKLANFRKNVIVIDRFVLDLITDLVYETGQDLVDTSGFMARAYIVSARRINLSIVFDLDPKLAYQRKIDVSQRELQIKRAQFIALASKSNSYLLDASLSFDQLSKLVRLVFHERLES